ncbi:hypothetical protein L6452_11654 [Arctium lappa]|uniref:Uncharacterized protein n=1 Tax=Arctium lappa TaxID=4217 RepID=A0ACB9DQP9_ARCLA|nr:hypothetical protein L6452_11654 [Arctium lappa]
MVGSVCVVSVVVRRHTDVYSRPLGVPKVLEFAVVLLGASAAGTGFGYKVVLDGSHPQSSWVVRGSDAEAAGRDCVICPG